VKISYKPISAKNMYYLHYCWGYWNQEHQRGYWSK